MTIIRWHRRPSMSEVMENMLERNLNTGFEKNCGCIPATNILENDDAFEIQLAVPGLNKQDFKLEVEEDVLSVIYEKDQKEGAQQEFLQQEFGFDGFTRSFSIPKTADAEKIKANYERGILYITIPKQDKARLSKEIKVS